MWYAQEQNPSADWTLSEWQAGSFHAHCPETTSTGDFFESGVYHDEILAATCSMVNIEENPTYVILDLGCARSMGSRKTVEAVEWAAMVLRQHM